MRMRPDGGAPVGPGTPSAPAGPAAGAAAAAATAGVAAATGATETAVTPPTGPAPTDAFTAGVAPSDAVIDAAVADIDWSQLTEDDSAAFMRAWYELGG